MDTRYTLSPESERAILEMEPTNRARKRAFRALLALPDKDRADIISFFQNKRGVCTAFAVLLYG